MDLAEESNTDLSEGLSSAEARRRLAVHGRNILNRLHKTPWPVKLIKNFFSFFAVLLWIAAILCWVPGVDMPQMGWAIVIVILVNGVFSFFQEQKSDRAVEALQAMMSPRCRVVRDGSAGEVDTTEIVPGDVLLLDEGDIVPADSRLAEAEGVEVDNSILTGESVSAPRYKSSQPVPAPGKFHWVELPNLVFAGTSLIKGHARAVVFATGMNTEVGKIARLTQGLKPEMSPLQKQLRSTVWAITALASIMGLSLLFLGWLLTGLTFAQAFVFFIGLFVANVPEGLMPTVTMALALGVTRMAKRSALVKSLPSVETLGCTTVICSDKTGTLTQNLMMVSRLFVDGQAVSVSGQGYEPEGTFQFDGHELAPKAIETWTALRRFLECAVACNNAKLKTTDQGTRVLGDPTEGALLALAAKGHFAFSPKRLHLSPFESIRKRMSVVTLPPAGMRPVAYVKGAPLELLERCPFIYWKGEVVSLGPELRQKVIAANDRMAQDGLRVLGLAYREDEELWNTKDEPEATENRLTFLGLAGLSDPVRKGVPEAIQACHSAGIRVLMITGDYPLTAENIGRQIGLGGQGALRVYSGAEVSNLSDQELKSVLSKGEAIFARVVPEHKLRIVSLLKAVGEIVAVTGDGVNDAPALKKADIGVAMGRRGHQVAREAAHIVLTDDNFGSIVAAIEEGRAVFDNIKRFTTYHLSTNPPEMYPYIFWMLVPGLPLAMTVMGVLAADVGTDLLPAMGLGIEPPEKDVMQRPPRPRDEKLLSLPFILRAYLVQGSLLTFSCYATYAYWGWVMGTWHPGAPLSSMPTSPSGLNFAIASTSYLQTLTAYFFPMVASQIANVLCRRSWKRSLFSFDFLSPGKRRELLDSLGSWKGSPALRPLARSVAVFFGHHPILLNFLSNPLIDVGIVFELLLCVFFFYSPLAKLYYFAPVPWHVYLFAFHGTLLMFAFEEVKKYFRRRGHPLAFLG